MTRESTEGKTEKSYANRPRATSIRSIWPVVRTILLLVHLQLVRLGDFLFSPNARNRRGTCSFCQRPLQRPPINLTCRLQCSFPMCCTCTSATKRSLRARSYNALNQNTTRHDNHLTHVSHIPEAAFNVLIMPDGKIFYSDMINHARTLAVLTACSRQEDRYGVAQLK